MQMSKKKRIRQCKCPEKKKDKTMQMSRKKRIRQSKCPEKKG